VTRAQQLRELANSLIVLACKRAAAIAREGIRSDSQEWRAADLATGSGSYNFPSSRWVIWNGVGTVAADHLSRETADYFESVHAELPKLVSKLTTIANTETDCACERLRSSRSSKAIDDAIEICQHVGKYDVESILAREKAASLLAAEMLRLRQLIREK
jgi:hypothetical protein